MRSKEAYTMAALVDNIVYRLRCDKQRVSFTCHYDKFKCYAFSRNAYNALKLYRSYGFAGVMIENEVKTAKEKAWERRVSFIQSCLMNCRVVKLKTNTGWVDSNLDYVKEQLIAIRRSERIKEHLTD